jgi:alcohol dehydrogenase class IV
MIGASYDVPHGITSCLTLPAVMKYQGICLYVSNYRKFSFPTFHSLSQPRKNLKILQGLKPELTGDDDQKNGETAAQLV